MKKQIGLFTAILFAVSTLMVSCSQEGHEHTFASEWTSDETNHWYAATCEHTTEVSGKAEHNFGDYVSNNDATTEADGTKTRKCSVCGCEDTVTDEGSKIHVHTFALEWTSGSTYHWHAATCGHTTEVSGKAEHNFGDYVSNNDATTEADGTKTRKCSVCGCEDTVTDEGSKIHVHTFALEWTSGSTYHWHAATCGHTTEVSGKAEHNFGDYVSNNDATTEADGTKTRECSVCGYKDTVTDEGSMIVVPEGFVFVKGTTINGNETWTPSSEVFVSGRKLTIPNLLVSDHEVTRGEYKAVMESDPSTANAYDKNGNKLTGEDVLNTPVNYVNWYDALVYCNKLSIKEKLTPCYSINDSTDPDSWGTVPTSSNSTWNAATCNFEADGYRLPTEAEWEWLARGGENCTYAGSNTVGDVAWYTENTNDTGTREVKTKAPNGYGLYDMSGNVFELCWDWYDGISSSSAADGAASGINRVNRGGSWFSGDDCCQVAGRKDGSPYHRDFLCGFRVVRSSSN